MKFSLILCTVNRVVEVKNLLDSLNKQTFKNFEVIIVDQNKDDSVRNISLDYSSLDIIYIKSELGLSKARNLGLKYYTGNIVCFPDDDCIYPENLLSNVYHFFSHCNYQILMGKTIDKNSNEIVAGKKTLFRQNLSTFYTLGSSTTLFILTNPEMEIEFDDNFGLGAKFGAEEENDLVFRLLKLGYKGYYDPNINFVFHPPSDLDFNDVERVKQRSVGLGAFISKHIFTTEGVLYFFKYNLIRPLLGSLIYIIRNDLSKSKFYFYRWVGIWKGFIAYRVNK